MANILGANLRELRRKRGLKQEDVANALGVPAATYSSWERGRTKPDYEWLPKFASYFAVSVDQLVHSEARPLKIGSSILITEEFFHPIKSQEGLYSFIYRLIFNQLYSYDIYRRQFHVELIDSWYADRSHHSYIFFLRDKVFFHNGDPLQPEDVEHSYNLFLKKYSFYKQFIQSVRIIRSKNAIELELDSTRWLELEHLPAPYIIPRAYGDDNECMVGTGPFRLNEKQYDRLSKDSSKPIILVSNEAYFSRIPSIQTIEFHRYEKTSELKEKLEGKELDLVCNPDPVESGKFEIRYDGASAFFLIFNQRKQICQTEDFRRAIDFALDRCEIRRSALGASDDSPEYPAYHLYFILRELPRPQEEPPRRDLKKAGKYLQNAKSSLGKSESEDLGLTLSSAHLDQETLRIMNEVASQLAKAGIPVKEIRSKEEGNWEEADVWVQMLNFREPEMVHWNLHSSVVAEDKHWTYSNPYLNHLLSNIKGIDTYRQIQDILSQEKIFLPLFRRGLPLVYTKELDTKSRPQEFLSLHGSDVVYWEFGSSPNP